MKSLKIILCFIVLTSQIGCAVPVALYAIHKKEIMAQQEIETKKQIAYREYLLETQKQNLEREAKGLKMIEVKTEYEWRTGQ